MSADGCQHIRHHVDHPHPDLRRDPSQELHRPTLQRRTSPPAQRHPTHPGSRLSLPAPLPDADAAAQCLIAASMSQVLQRRLLAGTITLIMVAAAQATGR